MCSPRNEQRTYGAADSDADADADADPDGDASTEPDPDASIDADADGAGTDGNGTGVGSGMNREGTPRNDSTKTSTKIAKMARIHGRANRSSRGGSDPR